MRGRAVSEKLPKIPLFGPSLIHLLRLLGSQQHPPSAAFCTNTSVSVADRPALKQNFMATLCSFPPSMTYKENRLYKTSYNS
jgi:hypothetical protein